MKESLLIIVGFAAGVFVALCFAGLLWLWTPEPIRAIDRHTREWIAPAKYPVCD